MSDHPIDPTLPRAGWLATVEDNKGTKKTRHFIDYSDACHWVETQNQKHKLVNRDVFPLVDGSVSLGLLAASQTLRQERLRQERSR